MESRGLVLAEDLLADRDYPPFDKSLMDGFAVRVADVRSTPTKLKCVGEVAAGGEAQTSFCAGETMAIMTGAPLPPGADGIVPVEDAFLDGTTITIQKAADAARLFSKRGSEAAAGQVILKRGATLGAAQIAAAATVGASALSVFARPRVAVLATGDELIAVDQTPAGSHIRNSNSPMLVALLQDLGCDVTDLGTARDKPGLIRERLQAGLAFDALFVTGGMSMGAYDYVPKLLIELGVQLKITKLRIKPGKPFIFGQFQRANSPDSALSHVFGLPGNPLAGFVCTHRLASRLLARLRGQAVTEKWIPATLALPLGANGPREFYLPVALEWKHTGPVVAPLTWTSSADIFTLAQAGGLLVRAENDVPLLAGAAVRILEIAP